MILPGKRQYLLESNISILIVILAAICVVFYPSLVLRLVFLGFIPSVFLIIFLFFPVKNEPSATIFKRLFSFFIVIGLQLFYILFSFSFIFCLLKSFLIPHEAINKVSPSLLAAILQQTAWLQPLSWITVAACGLHFYRYYKKQPAQFNNLFAPILKKDAYKGISFLIIHYISLATILIYCLFSLLAILLLTTYFSRVLHIKLLSGMTLEVLFFIPLLIYPLLTKYFLRLTRIMSRKHFSLSIYFLLTIVYFSFFVILFSFLTAFYKNHIPQNLLPHLNAHLNLINWHNAVLIFVFSWFILSAPLQGSLIARLGKSLNNSVLIIASSIIPSLVFYGLYCYYQPAFIVSFFVMHINALQTVTLFTVILFFLGQFKLYTSQVFEVGFSETMPNQDYKALNYVMRPLLLTVIIVCFIYLLNGIIFLHVLSFVLALPVMLILVFIGPSLWIAFKNAYHR